MANSPCRSGGCPYMELPDPGELTAKQKAQQNGVCIETLFGCRNNHHIFDDMANKIEIKSCQEYVVTNYSNGKRRFGRFSFTKHQHDELLKAGGRYRLVVHDGTCRILHQVLVEASEIDHLIRPTFHKKWTYFFPRVSAGGWPATVQEESCTP